MWLRRADCSGPGLQRIRRGRGFSYLDAAGRPLADEQTLARINALTIPPAWREPSSRCCGCWNDAPPQS
ncbi:MAG TPA: hypothetical protein VG228_05930 [Solirubrobacteraceae bacterium]|jgi:DNA topoisomerase-1|nr:hypothetical protein [Solirubrobacteraceae bacterium]